MTVIVVPLDGSAFADRALRPACSLAARGGARVLLVNCAGDDPDVGQQHLDDRADLFADVVPVGTRVLSDADPVQGILVTVAGEPDATLCMATHGRGGLLSSVMGSVAKRVVSRSTRPLVLVGPQCRTAILPGERGRLIACSDGSEFSNAIVPIADSWCARYELEPCLVEVVPPDEDVAFEGQTPRHRLADAALRRLEQLATRVTSSSRPVRATVLHGAASDAIAHHADRLPAALIAVTSHGRSGLRDVLLGSVAADVVRCAPCPVLLARPSDAGAAEPS